MISTTPTRNRAGLLRTTRAYPEDTCWLVRLTPMSPALGPPGSAWVCYEEEDGTWEETSPGGPHLARG